MLKMVKTSKQKVVNDCGLFVIAAATALAFDLNPVQFDQNIMREHLIKCFEERKMSPFPHNEQQL